MMRNRILAFIADEFVKMLSPELMRTVLDHLLVSLEQLAAQTDNTLDDKIVNTFCKLVRVTMQFPEVKK